MTTRRRSTIPTNAIRQSSPWLKFLLSLLIFYTTTTTYTNNKNNFLAVAAATSSIISNDEKSLAMAHRIIQKIKDTAPSSSSSEEEGSVDDGVSSSWSRLIQVLEHSFLGIPMSIMPRSPTSTSDNDHANSNNDIHHQSELYLVQFFFQIF